MIHSILKMVTIYLRAKGNTTHEMFHHTAAHGQVDVFNFCDDRSCIMESKLIAILPQKNMQAPAMFETSERGCEPPVSVNRQISSPTKKNEDDGEMQLLPFLS